MAEKKDKKPQINSDKTSTNVYRAKSSSTGVLDYFRFGESYTSLILGIVVVIIAAILLVSFVKNRNLDQLTESMPEISSTQTIRQAPTVAPTEYTVQAGDDLWKIAEKVYKDGYQWTVIAKANNISNPSQINTGQKIQLPKMEESKTLAQAGTTPTSTTQKMLILTPTQSVQTVTLTPIPTKRITATPTPSSTKSTPNVLVANTSPIGGNSYTVVSGDNLWNIAVRAYGDGFRWTEIAEANNLANPRVIHSGNVLIIPR